MLGLIILRYEKKNLLFTYQVILKVVLLLLSVFVFVVFMDGGLEWVLICQLLTLVLTSIVLYTNIKQYLLCSFSWKNLMMSFYNPQIQISAESETKRSIFREKDKTKRSKKESAQHSKSRNKSFVMTSVSAL